MKFTLFILLTAAAFIRLTAQNDGQIFFADPTVFVENDKYYLTGTKNREPLGFAILESEDLTNWSMPATSRDSLQMILKKGDHTYGSKGFWAPQILRDGSVYYLTHTANEQTVLTKSNSLFGPFRQDQVTPIDGTEKNIDSYLFKDDNGKYYLYHVRFDKGNYLWVAEFDLEKGKIIPETLTKCFSKTQAWEHTPAYKSNPIMEGPTVIMRKGKYYLFYSANHFRSVDYGVGYAVADSPMGPWTKHPDNPIIHRSIVGENGSGHGDLFEGLDGQMYYVYHIHNGDDEVVPRRVRIVPVMKEWNELNDEFVFSVDAENIIVPLQVVN